MASNSKDMESAFNEGMLQIQRLDQLWREANQHSRHPKDRSVNGFVSYNEWRWTLDAIWRELSRDALKDETGDVNIEEYKTLISENKWFQHYKELDKKISSEYLNPRKRYMLLCELEIYLRTLQDAVGKGGKYRDLDEDDLE